MKDNWKRRGYIPHFTQEGAPQFITTRLIDALPIEQVQEWLVDLKGMPRSKLQSQLRRRAEQYLDEGHGECWLTNHEVGKLVQKAVEHFHGVRIWGTVDTFCFASVSGFSSGIMAFAHGNHETKVVS